MSVYNNVLSEEDINYINTLPEVITAKSKLTNSNDKHTFYITLTDSIRASLNTIGLNLENITQIPMRWIRGDTLEHIDHGTSQFNNTYLLFMNNSPGSLVINDIAYSIAQNTAYVFNEGMKHKTQNTEGARLLIGPMNELVEPVGGSAYGIYYYANESDALSYSNIIASVYANFVLGNTDNNSLAGYPGTGNGWRIANNSAGISTGVHPNGDTLDNSDNISYYYVYPSPLNSVPCFVENTRILTNNGYKQINELLITDLIVTSDNRTIPYKLYKCTIITTSETAPYVIEPYAFGVNKPSNKVYLSPTHKIYLENDVWTSAEHASKTNSLVRQYDIGKSVTYYHIECNNYFTDNIITEDLIVESFGTQKSTNNSGQVWYITTDGFIRERENTIQKESINYTTSINCY